MKIWYIKLKIWDQGEGGRSEKRYCSNCGSACASPCGSVLVVASFGLQRGQC